MPDDYYTQADDGTPPPDDESPAENDGKDDSNTTLVPNSFFDGADKEVGSVCKIRIVHKFDSETEISYIAHDEEKSKSPNMDESEKSFDAMATEEA